MRATIQTFTKFVQSTLHVVPKPQVYYCALFADWLQGPYLYRLYEQYGYLQQQIAALYAVGYVAAMVSGPLLGGM